MMIMIMMTILILITLVIIKNRLIENYGNIVVISIRFALKGMCEHVKGKKKKLKSNMLQSTEIALICLICPESLLPNI